MIYRSNLQAPDLQPNFKHLLCRPMGHSIGHSVLSDFADSEEEGLKFYQKCGFWTHDEAAILFNVALQFRGDWLDIGSHTGWTAMHQAAAGCGVIAVDNMYRVEKFRERALENIGRSGINLFSGTSREFFEINTIAFDGVVIDGDHMAPHPEEDARNAAAWLNDRGVILFHDAIGAPVQDAVRYLISQGFKHKVYWTPHVVAVCWRGEFTPPEHVCDPAVKASVQQHYKINA